MILKPRPFRKPMKGHWASKGLLCYYLLNGGSGDIVQDLSENGRHGTFTAGVSWAAGKYGPGTEHSGIDPGYIAIPTLTLTKFTFHFCYNYDAYTNGWLSLAGSTDNPNDNALAINSSPYFLTRLSGNSNNSDAGTIDTTTDVWHTATFTWDGATVAWYQNGKFIDDNAEVDGPLIIDRLGWYYSQSYPFNGTFDHIIIYDRALVNSEITMLDREPFCMFERDPVELWVGATSVGAPPATIVSQIQYLRNMGVVA